MIVNEAWSGWAVVAHSPDLIQATIDAMKEIGATEADYGSYDAVRDEYRNEMHGQELRQEAGYGRPIVVLLFSSRCEPTRRGRIGWWLTVSTGRAYWNVYASSGGVDLARGTTDIESRDALMAMLRLAAA